jgi:hypothetical protein
MKKIFFPLVLLLGACATPPYNPYDNCSGLRPWVESAKCIDEIASYDASGNPMSGEINAYRRLLIQKVVKHKMTNEEAEYAMAVKSNEINARLERQRNAVLPQPIYSPSPVYLDQRPIRTTCINTIDGMRCDSTHSGPDLSVFKKTPY